MASFDVSVIGAGVSGLTTAVCLAESGIGVQIIAEDLPQQTTSAVASAMCGPVIDRPGDPSVEWELATVAEMTAIASQIPDSGVHLAIGLLAARWSGGAPPLADTSLQAREATRDELPAGFASGFWATLPLVDMPIYLDYLTARFAAAGGTIMQRRVARLGEIAGEAPLIVNCAGVYAHHLVPDDAVRPVRGQHVIVENPGLDGFFMEAPVGPAWVGYHVHGNRVVVGGVAEKDGWSRIPSPEVAQAIIERCAAVEPRIRDARIIDHQVGLRPNRHAIRIELDTIAGSRLVHNYGHGGSGVSLSWGCAREAVRLLVG